MKTVEITIDEEGEVLVGLRPEDADHDEMMDGSYLTPAGTVEEALAMAKDLLVGETEDEMQGMAEEDMMGGFQKVRPPEKPPAEGEY